MSDKDSSKVTFGLEMQHFMMADICLWAGFHKVGCGFPMVVVSILPHAKFGPNDRRVDAIHFILFK